MLDFVALELKQRNITFTACDYCLTVSRIVAVTILYHP